jgi:bifunctional N-acetylglucosamine-1-phosphate-uridyltransferase/glucosamine-1-phosphate-acetyltransferase GlmU-like protein
MFSCFKCSIRSEKITISENPVSENPISENPITIIMAGGLGKRMNSPIPKVLHLVKDKPMIYYVIQKALEINSTHILIIVGKYKDLIQKEIESLFSATEYSRIVYINQPEVLINDELKVQGTGDAIKCCIPFLVSNNINPESNVIILSGDVPLIEKETIENLLFLLIPLIV